MAFTNVRLWCRKNILTRTYPEARNKAKDVVHGLAMFDRV